MKSKAVRLYGKEDIRLENIELPDIKLDEIFAEIISDTACMSSYKEYKNGEDHPRVPDNIANEPIIIGHEFCGRIIQVGDKWKDRYKEGDKFVVQPALNNGTMNALGYSYKYIGGCATYVIIPNEVIENNCLFTLHSGSYYKGSLAEPLNCIVSAFNAQYHSSYTSHTHLMGCKDKGTMAVFGGAGPMGLGVIDYALHSGGNTPSMIIVVDQNSQRLKRAESIFKNGTDKTKLFFVNSLNIDNLNGYLSDLSGNCGYDDIFIMVSKKEVVEMSLALLSYDGCLNVFSGPQDRTFSANVNFHDIHYRNIHIVGTNCGTSSDMEEALRLIETNRIDPSVMISHIGGLDSVENTIKNLPKADGYKKLVYTHKSFPLTGISDFAKSGRNEKEREVLTRIYEVCEKNNGLWCREAEKIFLENIKEME